MAKQSANPRIGIKEMTVIVTLYLSAKAFLSYAVPLYHYGVTAAWMIPLLHTLLAFIAILPLLWLLKRHPGKNMIQIGDECLGPRINAVLSAFFVVILVTLSAVVLRQFSEWVITGFLPSTPISVVVLLFVVAASVIAFLGFDAIVRSAYIFGIFIALGAVTLTALSIPFWRLESIFPLGGAGAVSILKGALLTSGNMVEIFILGLIISFLPQKCISRVSVVSILLAGTMMFISTLAPLLTFTYPVVRELSIPTLEVARIITASRFLLRLEAVFAPIWILTALVNISLGIYLITSVTTYALRLPYNRPFILPAAVVVTATAFFPANVVEALTWDVDVVRRYSFFAVGLPLTLLYGLTLWRDRRGGVRDERQKTRR